MLEQVADPVLKNPIGRQPDRVLVAFGLQELVDLGVGKGGIGAEVAAKVSLPIAGHGRCEHVLPAVRRMDVARAQRRTLQIAELVEHEQWMVAGAGEVAVVGGTFLIAMRRTDTRIHIEHDGPQRAMAMSAIDPLPGETGERGKVLVARQPLGLEPPHLAGRGRVALDSVAADNPAHRRITPQPVGVVVVFVSRKPTKHRLAQHTYQIMLPVPARAAVNQMSASDGHQAERVIEFAIGEQACIGGDTGTVELKRLDWMVCRLILSLGDCVLPTPSTPASWGALSPGSVCPKRTLPTREDEVTGASAVVADTTGHAHDIE